MDASENEIASVELSGFPTVVFWPGEAGDPVKYNGAKTVEGFINFLKDHTRYPLPLAVARSP